jgi:hypothetical protein
LDSMDEIDCSDRWHEEDLTPAGQAQSTRNAPAHENLE